MLLEQNRKEEDEEDITSGTHQSDQKKREKQMIPKTKKHDPEIQKQTPTAHRQQQPT
jgi:hypothetical protein